MIRFPKLNKNIFLVLQDLIAYLKFSYNLRFRMFYFCYPF